MVDEGRLLVTGPMDAGWGSGWFVEGIDGKLLGETGLLEVRG